MWMLSVHMDAFLHASQVWRSPGLRRDFTAFSLVKVGGNPEAPRYHHHTCHTKASSSIPLQPTDSPSSSPSSSTLTFPHPAPSLSLSLAGVPGSHGHGDVPPLERRLEFHSLREQGSHRSHQVTLNLALTLALTLFPSTFTQRFNEQPRGSPVVGRFW